MPPNNAAPTLDVPPMETTSPGSSSGKDPLDPEAGTGSGAPVSDEEDAAMRGEDGAAERPSPIGGKEVPRDGESGEEPGEEPDGESAESDEASGEESNEADGEAEEWKAALKLAGGNKARAAQIIADLHAEDGEAGGEGRGSRATVDDAELEKSISAEVEKNLADFYKERGTEDAPGDEPKAFAKLLARQQVATLKAVGTILDRFEGNLKAERTAEKGFTELFKQNKDWLKHKPAFERFVASDPSLRRLSPARAYRIFAAEKLAGGGPSAAKKTVAAANAANKGTRAAPTAGGGRAPGGPIERKPTTETQREMRALRDQPRVPAIP